MPQQFRLRARSARRNVAIINSVDIASSQQVQLNVRFVEINRQAGHELSSKISASFWVSGGAGSFNEGVRPSETNPISRILGQLADDSTVIDVSIKALEDRGLARRLAEPNLIARSGERASFLAGGEFPIPVPGDEGRVTIEYKNYGVSLDFLPTVLKDGLISLEIEPEVSSIDPSSSYRVGDISIPGFAVRRAKTSVDLKSGQSFMVAGLLQTQNDQVAQRIPGVGRLPVIGALFSSKAYQRRETDLVIIITPHLVKPMDPTKKPRTPFDGVSAGSNADYFLANVGEVRANGQPVDALAFHGGPAFGHFLDLE